MGIQGRDVKQRYAVYHEASQMLGGQTVAQPHFQIERLLVVHGFEGSTHAHQYTITAGKCLLLSDKLLAAQSSVAASWNDPLSTLQVNAGGAIHLLEALRAERLSPRVLLVGSGEQYGLVKPEENPINEDSLPRPINPYGVSKLAQDLYGYQYFITYGLPILRARPFNHFGLRQTATFVVADFARQIVLIEQGKVEPILSVGNLQTRRDFLPVEDVVRADLAI